MFQELAKIIPLGTSLLQLPSTDLSALKCHFLKSMFLLAFHSAEREILLCGIQRLETHSQRREGLGCWAKLRKVAKAFDYHCSKPLFQKVHPPGATVVREPWLISPPPPPPLPLPPLLMDDRALCLLPRLLGVWLDPAAPGTRFIMRAMPQMG